MIVQNQIDFYKQALEAAEKEKQDVLAQLKALESLQRRLVDLNNAIKGLQKLIGEGVAEQQDPSTEVGSLSQHSSESAEGNFSKAAQLLIELDNIHQQLGTKRFEQVEQILKDSGRSMKFPEIIREFHRREWLLNRTPVGAQTIRNAVQRKPDIFVKKEDGTVGLKEWENENTELTTN